MSSNPYGGVYMAAGALVACISIAIAAIVGSQFMDYYYRSYGSGGYGYRPYSSTCYLGPIDSSYNACIYNYAVGAVGIFLSIFTASLACARNRNPRKPTTQLVAAVAGTVWFLAAGITNTITLQRANEVNDISDTSLDSYRSAIIGLSWAAFALFVGATIAAVSDHLQYKRNPPQFANAAQYPQQAYPQQGYPQQAYAPQPPPYGAYPQQPYYAAGPPPGYPGQPMPGYGAQSTPPMPPPYTSYTAAPYPAYTGPPGAAV